MLWRKRKSRIGSFTRNEHTSRARIALRSRQLHARVEGDGGCQHFICCEDRVARARVAEHAAILSHRRSRPCARNVFDNGRRYLRGGRHGRAPNHGGERRDEDQLAKNQKLRLVSTTTCTLSMDESPSSGNARSMCKTLPSVERVWPRRKPMPT